MAGKLTVNTVQLGDNSTAANNFVLKTNADGTATLARGNDGATTQDILTIDANGVVTLTQGSLIGVNQTWQDVSASRAHSVTYTNDTDSPIMVNIAVTNTTTRQVEVDGVNVGYFAAADAVGTVSFIVPVGSEYIIQGSVTSILDWSELR